MSFPLWFGVTWIAASATCTFAVGFLLVLCSHWRERYYATRRDLVTVRRVVADQKSEYAELKRSLELTQELCLEAQSTAFDQRAVLTEVVVRCKSFDSNKNGSQALVAAGIRELVEKAL